MRGYRSDLSEVSSNLLVVPAGSTKIREDFDLVVSWVLLGIVLAPSLNAQDYDRVKGLAIIRARE